MSRILAAGIMALLVTAPPAARAQSSPAQSPSVTSTSGQTTGRANVTDSNALTDARIAVVKSTLQLTPDQEKLWPPIESAIRDRAKDRESRITKAERTIGEARENPVEAIRDRNPIDFMNRRADAIEQRASDLKKLASAWQPLYQTLTPEQKRRMGALAIAMRSSLRSGREERRLQTAEDPN